jgi:hypothetical protein
MFLYNGTVLERLPGVATRVLVCTAVYTHVLQQYLVSVGLIRLINSHVMPCRNLVLDPAVYTVVRIPLLDPSCGHQCSSAAHARASATDLRVKHAGYNAVGALRQPLAGALGC